MKTTTFSHWLLLLSPLLFAFTIPMDDDNFNFYLSTERVFSPTEGGISVSLSGQMQKSTTFQFKAYRITDPVEFFLAQKDPHTLDLGDDDDTTAQSKRRRPVWSKYKVAAEWEQTIKATKYRWFNETVKAPVRESGVYLVVATARDKQAAAVLILSNLGMVTKQADGTALAFVMNRANGQRETNVPLTFMRGGATLATSNTGASGMAQITVPDLPEKNDGDDEPYYWRYGNGLVVMGQKNGEFVISDSYFYGYRRGSNNVQTYLHTDRPVYRPAQKVYYRGIARQVLPDGTFKLITNDTVQIEVNDARGTTIKRDTLPLSDFGTFSGELMLGDEPPLGSYAIRTNINGSEGYFSFQVQEYKKPEYEVTVTADKAQYTRGDKLTATVKADYYFGSPVAEGEVEYRIYRARYWRPWWYRTEWAYLYDEKMMLPQYGMEMIHNGSGTLNDDGTFTIDYTTDGKATEDYIYQVQATVVDASRRAISGSAGVKVTRGEFFITTRTDKYLYKPNDEIALTVQINTFDGDKPVATGFKARVLRTWWEPRKRGGSSDRREETIWTGSGSTGSDGSGVIRIPAGKSGYYNLEVEAADSRGTTITETSYIYVAEEGYAWYNDGSSDIQIIPDKDLYKPGETMSALVVMPAENIDVLVTGEGPTIYGAQVERLNGRSAIVRMKIEERQAPVFYLAVSSIANDQFYSHQQRITVAPVGKRLRIEVKTDKPQYKPGETGTVTLRARNEQGEPAAMTDIALGIVDEAIYAIRPESAPDIQKFFYGDRGNQVSTNTSLYFRFSTRSVFKSVALSEASSDSMGILGGRVAESAPMMAKRNGGGDGESEAYVQPTLRKDFQDLMFWTPSVRTDASGRATLTVKFPDNLTTWRITARGVTQGTAVGQATAEVIARKELLARMETPRFITSGDRLMIATTIHNYLATEKRTKVEFLVEGVVAKERERTVMIPANGETRIDWEITAPKAGEAKLTVRALTDEESDAMELKVPVLPLGIKQAVAGIADLDDRTPNGTINLLLPPNADPTTGELTLSLSPSPASSLLGALDDLIGYPYGCVEQTMSRFLPTVVVADALKKLDVPFDAKKREELPKMVAKGLNRLYELQHSDGGWGWWENDKTNAFMTAYVIYGMAIAAESGYDVESRRLERGNESLQQMIASNDSPDDKTIDPTTRAWMLYVAAMQSGTEGDLKNRIEKLARRNDLNNYARALLALAATHQGATAVAGKMVSQLEKNVTQTQTGAFWKGTTWHYNWQDDQVETTAWVLKAMLQLRGETDLTRKATRWLLTQKQGSSWGNTRQTAMVVFALADHLKSTNQLDPDMTITAQVNGKQVASQRITKGDLFKEEIKITVPASGLNKGENRVEITRSGRGTLYATARLSYYATGSAIKPADAGFAVKREYWTLERVRDGKKYIYKKRPFNGTVKSGEELFVKVTVVPNAAYDYFMLEDPLPAGCEVITETSGYEIPGENGYGGNDDGGGYRPWRRSWNWWYADRDVRDEKVSFFSTRIEGQEYEFSYILRAQIPGSYAVMPAVGALMYYPEVRGNSGVVNVKIEG